MEATKKVTGKSVKWLGNSAIIVLMLAVSLIVGIITNLRTGQYHQPVQERLYPLHHRSRHFGCLITTGNDLSAGRPGWFRCLPGLRLCADRGGAASKFYPQYAHPAHPRGLHPRHRHLRHQSRSGSSLVVSYLKVGLHRYPGYAAGGLQYATWSHTGGTPSAP